MNHHARVSCLLTVVALLLATTVPISAQEPKLRTKLTGHTDDVMSVALSGDGKLLASASRDGTVKLWDVATGKELHTLKGHPAVRSVAFSRDGKWLASVDSVDEGSGVKLWNVATGKEKATFGGRFSVALSGDGKLLASVGNEGVVKLWDVATVKEKPTLQHLGFLRYVALSEDGKWLASGGDSTVKLWDVATGKETLTLNLKGVSKTGEVNAGVYAVAFSGDGKLLASAGMYGTLKLWDVTTGKEKAPLKPHSDHIGTLPIYSVALSGDGKTLAFASTAGVRLRETPTDKETTLTVEGDRGLGTPSVALSGDGSLVAAGHGKTVILWDIPVAKKADK